MECRQLHAWNWDRQRNGMGTTARMELGQTKEWKGDICTHGTGTDKGMEWGQLHTWNWDRQRHLLYVFAQL